MWRDDDCDAKAADDSTIGKHSTLDINSPNARRSRSLDFGSGTLDDTVWTSPLELAGPASPVSPATSSSGSVTRDPSDTKKKPAPWSWLQSHLPDFSKKKEPKHNGIKEKDGVTKDAAAKAESPHWLVHDDTLVASVRSSPSHGSPKTPAEAQTDALPSVDSDSDNDSDDESDLPGAVSDIDLGDIAIAVDAFGGEPLMLEESDSDGESETSLDKSTLISAHHTGDEEGQAYLDLRLASSEAAGGIFSSSEAVDCGKHKTESEPEVGGFTCAVCLMNCHLDEGYSFAVCGHTFCRDCLQRYLEIKIADGEGHEIRCPTIGCLSVLKLVEVEQLVRGKVLEQLHRFEKMRANPNWRQCPGCGHLQLGLPKKLPKLLQMTCEQCSHAFCFHHGDAHTNSTCKAYLKSIKEAEKLSSQWAKANCRKCPKCHAVIEKLTDTCNHMVCRCGHQFCWICNGRYNPKTCNDLWGHYSVFNPFGCPGLQFTPVTPARLYGRRATIVLLSPLLLLALPFYCLRQSLLKRRYRSIQRQFQAQRQNTV